MDNCIEIANKTVVKVIKTNDTHAKFELWKHFNTLCHVLEFDMRAQILNMIEKPKLEESGEWHLSSCPYKRHCSCNYYISLPDAYFTRESENVVNVLNRGFHWSYCPVARIAKDHLMTINVEGIMDIVCMCRVR
ncbi:uncharacterized protein CEXT_760341 [Caerostris extrusa]|uniref:Uncharacterized protein n=1 Tax=Caerostris extrusa TaxID=172846 RepID=A0AAV4U974_CAEEX|nr:uncharacterized protein CEXT_760341 [Caerostris extrusa]